MMKNPFFWMAVLMCSTAASNGENFQSHLISDEDRLAKQTIFIKRWDRKKDWVLDRQENLMWQDNNAVANMEYTWQNAKRYCHNLSLDGYSDWALPTIEQLQSLVDLNKYRPAVKEDITEISVLTFYWSSTTFIEDEKKAWYVFYKYGESYYANKGERYGVRCVRELH